MTETRRWGRRIIGLAIGIPLGLSLIGGALLWAAYEKWFPFGGWRYIVVHHSATPSGSAAAFDRYHRERGFLGGLAYHFVIGNGRGAPDGSIQEGHRWTASQAGGHVSLKAWSHDVFGIGICLVGNLEQTPPTTHQRDALVDLVTRLARKHEIPPEQIVGHTEVPWFRSPDQTERTACPGRNLDLEALRGEVAERLDRNADS